MACGGYRVIDNEVVGHIQLWDVATGQSRHAWSLDECVSALAFSADGSTLASGGGGMVHPNPKGTIKLWDTRSAKLKRSMKGHANSVGELLFSHDGSLLASSAPFNKEVGLWSAR
ncbi:MAG: hypothetical protein GY903_30365 [Fuerstiella sp.]|nr:hypothetical protein [Fuerstiella sp.]MCP4858799.1 hypothetical protein [Fuerstiella sp.]